MAATTSPPTVDVYLEVGAKRTFAGAVAWPGWCRSGRTREQALEALLGSSERYGRVLRGTRLGFRPADDIAAFAIVERLTGDATTDFGAPSMAPSADAPPMDEAELRRLRTILGACWRAFDSATEAASGKELTKGPRGGRRELTAIAHHVLGADAAYLGRLARKHRVDESGDLEAELASIREAILEALAAAVRGEIPERGPRGGVLWAPRYFARRVAWHVLDHAWEIEDRTV